MQTVIYNTTSKLLNLKNHLQKIIIKGTIKWLLNRNTHMQWYTGKRFYKKVPFHEKSWALCQAESFCTHKCNHQ